MFETIDEVICESEYNVALSMFDTYNKYFEMKAKGLDIETDIVFTEADIPKRETLLEKIIWFIPDMIRKFIAFIKKKLGKVTEQPAESVSQKVANTVKSMKNNKGLEKKVAASLAAAGLALTATATGYVIYNKHKQKVIEITSEEDDTQEIEVTLYGGFGSFENYGKILNTVTDVTDMLFKFLSTSDSTAHQKEYSSLLKKVNISIAAMKKWQEEYTKAEGTKMTIVEVLSALKRFEDELDRASGAIARYGNKKFTSGKEKYNQVADDLNKALAQWSSMFNELLKSSTSNINFIGIFLYSMSTDPLGVEHGTEKVPYVDAIITYCSYRGSGGGFTFAAETQPDIDNPGKDFARCIPSSEKTFNQLGNIGKVIAKIMALGYIAKPAWGCVNGKYFVTTPLFEHNDTWGTDTSHPGQIFSDTDKTFTTYESYGIIISALDKFKRIAHGLKVTPQSFLSSRVFDHWININDGETTEDNEGIILNNPYVTTGISKLVKSGTSPSKDLIPDNDEIVVNLSNPTMSGDLYKDFREFGSDIKVTKIKSSPGYYKIYLNGNKSKS